MAKPCRGESIRLRRNRTQKRMLVPQTPQSEIKDFGQLPYRGAKGLVPYLIYLEDSYV